MTQVLIDTLVKCVISNADKRGGVTTVSGQHGSTPAHLCLPVVGRHSGR